MLADSDPFVSGVVRRFDSSFAFIGDREMNLCCTESFLDFKKGESKL